MKTVSKIKNIDKAAERIKRAVANKERIIIYADSDADGICSAVIMQETIGNLNGEVSAVVFPDRENDGYGINLKALDFLKFHAPALFVTLDLGIGNVEEIEVANKMGFETVIVDHHIVPDKLPRASIIVDPQQKDDSYPFKGLCNAGLTFKLAEEIFGDSFSERFKNSLLELTALATISDMVPQIEDNKIFIEEGLMSLPNTFRPGLKAFMEILSSSSKVLRNGIGGNKKETENIATVAGKIISAINVAESKDYRNEAFELLTNSLIEQCIEIAEKLLIKVQIKRQRVKEITEEIERRVMRKSDESIIFEGDPAFKLTLAGTVASIIAGDYKKPAFIFKRGDDVSCGSVRSPKGINSVEMMKTCSDLLISYGGHPQASGFRVKTENLEKLKICLIDFFKKE